MEFFIGIIIFGLLFFISNGFNVRCPYCGTQSKSQHKKINNLGYADTVFSCYRCGHEFSREICADWLERENEVGKEQSIKEYKDILDN